MTTFRISADIRYLSGALTGLTIPAGYSVTTPDRGRADSIQRWLNKVHTERDFIRAAGTGNRYEIAGNIHREKLI